MPRLKPLLTPEDDDGTRVEPAQAVAGQDWGLLEDLDQPADSAFGARDLLTATGFSGRLIPGHTARTA